MDLNTYGYPVDVGLVTKCEQLLSSIKVVVDKQTIHDAVSESIEPLNDRFDEVNDHIENAKDEIIENCGSFFDVIYNPTETLLMKKARALGKTAVGGASMLVYQAVKAHEYWYGGHFAPEDISKIILDVENEVNNMNS